MEFGVVMPRAFAALQRKLPEVLEDGDNEVPDMDRATLHRLYFRFLDLRADIQAMDAAIKALVMQHPGCSRLTALEGVGPISAVLLYASLGNGQAFSGSREFAAYLGLTPRQLSSGGKTNIVGLSKRIGNCRLRSILIQGARSCVHRLKEPKTPKDRWLMDLIERAGHGKAAVALANKNARTAWAMLTQGTDYPRKLFARLEEFIYEAHAPSIGKQGVLFIKSIRCCAVMLMAQFMVASIAAADDTNTKQSAHDFQTARFNAMVDADVERLRDFLADDLTYTHTTGWIETNSEFLSTVESGRIDYMVVTPREVNVRVYGDIAVMTGLSRMQGKVGDRAVDFTTRFTDVSGRVGNSWQLVAWQSAKLATGDN